MPGEVIDYSTAMVKVNEDGSVDISTALMCHGGGTLDACAKLVAEEMGVPFDLVGISPASTTDTGYDVCTHATRGVYCGGGSAVEAARSAKAVLLEFASRLIEVNPAALQIAPDPETGEGVIFLEGAADKRITVREVAKTAQLKGWGTAIAVESHRMVNCPPCFVTNFVEVEVDTWTGEVRVPRAVCAVDAGTVVNPDLAAGQLEGGLCRGIGQALLEDTAVRPRDRRAHLRRHVHRLQAVHGRGHGVGGRRQDLLRRAPTSRRGRSAPRGSARRPTTPWRPR